MELLTPTGRIVQGTPFTYSSTNEKGVPLTFRDGSPRKSYWFSMSVKKTNKKMNEFIDCLVSAAKADYPDHAASIKFPLDFFSWKVLDGDDEEWSSRDGWAGCWILKFQTSFPPQVLNAATKEEILIPDQFKTGDYAQVYVRVGGNGNEFKRNSKPGIYLNQLAVCKIADGDPIQNKPDYSSVFNKINDDL